jgi:hypothetical protein
LRYSGRKAIYKENDSGLLALMYLIKAEFPKEYNRMDEISGRRTAAVLGQADK